MGAVTRRTFAKSAAVAGVATALGASRAFGRERSRPARLHRPRQPRRPGARRLPRASGRGGRRDLRSLAALPGLRRAEDRHRPEAVQGLPASCSTGRTSTRWSSARRTTGTRSRRSTPARPARTCTSRSRSRSASRKAAAMVEAAREARSGDAGRPEPALDAVLPGGGGSPPQRRHRHDHRRALVPHPERVAEGHRQRRPTKPRPPGSTGTPGSARRPSSPTTGTAPSTASAGSTTTPAGRSPTSARTSWTSRTGRSATRRRSPSRPWARKLGDRRQPRDPRHARGAVDLPRRDPGHLLAVQRQRRPRRPPAVEPRVPRHPGHAPPRLRELRGRAGGEHRQDVPGPHAARPDAQPGLPVRPQDARSRQGTSTAPTARLSTPATSSTACAAAQRCTCDIETGHRSTTAALIANIALQTKSYLEWDARGRALHQQRGREPALEARYRRRTRCRRRADDRSRHARTRRRFLGAASARGLLRGDRLAGAGSAARPRCRPAAARPRRAAPTPASSASSRSPCPDMDWRRLARSAKRLGFDGLDLTVRKGGHVLPERAAEDLPRAVATAREEGLDVPMITTALTSADDPTARAILSTAAGSGSRSSRRATTCTTSRTCARSWNGPGASSARLVDLATRVRDPGRLPQPLRVRRRGGVGRRELHRAPGPPVGGLLLRRASRGGGGRRGRMEERPRTWSRAG